MLRPPTSTLFPYTTLFRSGFASGSAWGRDPEPDAVCVSGSVDQGHESGQGRPGAAGVARLGLYLGHSTVLFALCWRAAAGSCRRPSHWLGISAAIASIDWRPGVSVFCARFDPVGHRILWCPMDGRGAEPDTKVRAQR